MVLARETDRLSAFLRLRQPIDAALASGRIQRTKVAESWVYHPATVRHGDLIGAAASSADRVLRDRLVVPLSVLAGMVSAVMDPPTSKGAARALLHELVASGTLGRLGLLTAQDEPHLALYRRADAGEVGRQLDRIRSSLLESRQVSHRDLPEPAQPRQGRAWAETLIEHGEFAGWGRLVAGSLRPWSRP